jgi:hypothetical protein
MERYFFWTFMLAILAVLSVGILVFVRAYLTGSSPSALLFRPRTARRLEVIEQASLDNRRKLVLIRRDDVEHLLMTGGPVDVVVETGINPQAAKPAPVPVMAQENGTLRRPPTLGRVGGSTAAEPGQHDL